jgi:2-polyprenyl-3-methyl-5-hydroxy-6-metoxy-1,4-benzoquinol methylase
MPFSSLFPVGSRRRKFIRQLLLDTDVPTHLSRKFRAIDGIPSEVDLEEEEIGDTYAGRLAIARRHVVPWLDRSCRMREGCRILEIGSGRGASTIALAEQGCQVTGLDVDATSLDEAKELCRKIGLDVRFVVANATDAPQKFDGEKFDLIIFYASLEHMTHEERLAAMRGTWEMLDPGGFWCVTGTPNRLWYFDYHTAYLPFYFWLPDDLAFAYAKRSNRKNFRELYEERTDEKTMHFLRRGRGLSFHEFDLAMKPVTELDVVSSLTVDLRESRAFNRWRWRFKREYQYSAFLHRLAPKIHPGFFEKSLDLLIRK